MSVLVVTVAGVVVFTVAVPVNYWVYLSLESVVMTPVKLDEVYVLEGLVMLPIVNENAVLALIGLLEKVIVHLKVDEL